MTAASRSIPQHLLVLRRLEIGCDNGEKCASPLPRLLRLRGKGFVATTGTSAEDGQGSHDPPPSSTASANTKRAASHAKSTSAPDNAHRKPAIQRHGRSLCAHHEGDYVRVAEKPDARAVINQLLRVPPLQHRPPASRPWLPRPREYITQSTSSAISCPTADPISGRARRRTISLNFGLAFRARRGRCRSRSAVSSTRILPRVPTPYGGASPTPRQRAYPADPVLATAINWYAGNYKNGGGAYSVGEALSRPICRSSTPMPEGGPISTARCASPDYSSTGHAPRGRSADRICRSDGLRIRRISATFARLTCPNCSPRPSRRHRRAFFDLFQRYRAGAAEHHRNVNLTPEIARTPRWASPSPIHRRSPAQPVGRSITSWKITDGFPAPAAQDICKPVLPHRAGDLRRVQPEQPERPTISSTYSRSTRIDLHRWVRYRGKLIAGAIRSGLSGNLTLRTLVNIRRFITDTGLLHDPQ
ncbi:unnamed protein product [Acanthosepion pharaonis]|uniref:Uncharacterized protein n=1 Tax=Acanthosepion pharaonis TaxID=158019 RepID=A0A812DHU3_ACAPH|nr:unnamed protein product [Sepia pharaonis]